MTVEQEDKIRKSLLIFTLLVIYPLNKYLNEYLDRDDAELSLAILLLAPLLVLTVAILVLTYRKFSRDKQAGKDLKRYKTVLFFMGTGLLMGLVFLIYGFLT